MLAEGRLPPGWHFNMKTDKSAIHHSHLDSETLDRITPFGVIKSYRAEEAIHHRGDPAETVGVVLSGGVALSTIGKRGKRLISVILLRGELYGAYPLQTGRPRTLDAHATSDTQVLTFNRAAFSKLLDEDREFRERFIILLSDAIERITQALDDQRRLPLSVRLAKILLRHSRNPQRVVELTQSELAQLLAVSRYALGNDMGKLAKLGLVKTGYGRIEVVSREALRAWVSKRIELAPP
jgi:CRP/FNR family transcriptional regulator, cyclic AMP receptor protein